jgi:outer membrane translocation and assembly module TamA
MEIVQKGSNDERMINELYDYMTSTGIEHLQSLGQSILQTQKLIQEKEKEYKRMIKKEKKNLENQIKICQKLGSELKQSGLSNIKESLVISMNGS